MTTGFRVAAATVAATAGLLLSCSGQEAGDGASRATLNLGGDWYGLLSEGGSVGNSFVQLEQHGTNVAGALGGGALLGTANGASLSFTLTFGGLCTGSAYGSGALRALADRDRLTLSYFGSTTCEGAIDARGTFDRMRCPAENAVCQPDGQLPACVDTRRDPSNCGWCGRTCGSYQVCSAGRCEVPACTGPVPLQSPIVRDLIVPQYPYAEAIYPGSMAIGDANGDGIPDVIVADSDSGTLALLMGDGRGALSAPLITEMAGRAGVLAVGDLDRDGNLDLVAYVAANEPPATDVGRIRVLLGNGDGSFRTGQVTDPLGTDRGPYPIAPRPMALADLGGDGVLDLVSWIGEVPALQVFLGVGDGTFAAGQGLEFPGVPGALLAADLDGDGKVDLAVAAAPDVFSPDQDTVVLLGNGDGTFRPPATVPGVRNARWIAAGDFDENGVADLALGGFGSYPQVAVQLGTGGGSFAPPTAVASPGTFPVVVADGDGDGHADVVFADVGPVVARGRGDGTFADGVQFPLSGEGGHIVAMGVADMDLDGAPDLVVASFDYTVAVFLACPR